MLLQNVADEQRIFQISFDKTVVIISELPNNPGRSITDEALTLIHLVCYKFRLSPTKIMWVEHYPSGYLKDDDAYEQIDRFNSHLD